MNRDFKNAVKKLIVPIVSIGVGVPVAAVMALANGWEMDHREDPDGFTTPCKNDISEVKQTSRAPRCEGPA